MQEAKLDKIIKEIQEAVNYKYVGIFLGKKRKGKADIFFIQSYQDHYSCRTSTLPDIENYEEGKISWEELIELILDYGQRVDVAFHRERDYKFLKYVEMERMLDLAKSFMTTKEFQEATLQGYENIDKNKDMSNEELFAYVASNFDKILKLMVFNDNKVVSFSEAVTSILEEK